MGSDGTESLNQMILKSLNQMILKSLNQIVLKSLNQMILNYRNQMTSNHYLNSNDYLNWQNSKDTIYYIMQDPRLS